jgi:hypothetical protein
MNGPLSVYSAKTHLHDLYTPEIFVVMVIRLRAATEHDPLGVAADWRQGMAAAGVTTEGVAGFDMFMQLLSVIMRWPLDVRNLHCRCLGEGEAWLLQVISLLQHDSEHAAEQILARWLPASLARVAVRHMQNFAVALTTTRLVVPLRHQHLPVFDIVPNTATGLRGRALVH